MTPRIPHVIVKELCNLLDISIFMNMLAFDPIRAMSHDFLSFTIPPEVYKKSKAVGRLESQRRGTNKDWRRTTSE